MSRARNFFHGVWSGYTQIIVSSLVNLLTIPLGLVAVGKESYGLWLAVQQVAIFSTILDLGLSSSMPRFITNRRECGTPCEYAGFIKSLFVIGSLQGAAFLLAAWVLRPYIASILGVDLAHRAELERLLGWILLTVGLGFPLRPLHHLIYSSLKQAHFNLCSLAASLANGGLVVAGLWLGWGLDSFIAGAWASFAVMQTGMLGIVLRLQLMPKLKGARIRLSALLPMIKLSGNVSVLTVGVELINFAPTVLLTRQFGVSAMADWTVGTRLLQLAQQLVWRISGTAEPIFWQMHERGEIARLKQRMLDVMLAVGTVAAFLAGGILAFNGPFVRVLTSGTIEWHWTADVCLFAWLLLLSQASVLNMIPGTTKRVGAMKYVYLLEGAMLLATAYLPSWAPGSYWHVGLILGLGVTLFRLPYGLFRAGKDFHLRGPELRPVLGRVTRVALCLLGYGMALAAITSHLPALPQMLVVGLLYPAIVLPLLYLWVVPAELKRRARSALARFRPPDEGSPSLSGDNNPADKSR